MRIFSNLLQVSSLLKTTTRI